MSPLPQVSRKGRPPENRLALAFKWIACSLLFLLGLGIYQSMRAAKKFLAPKPVHAVSTSTPPKLAKGYGKLPLSFEANQGQPGAPVRFLARGRGYSIFLTGNEAVLSVRKTQPGKMRRGNFGPLARRELLGRIDLRAGRWPSLDGRLEALGQPLVPYLSRLLPGQEAADGKMPEEEPPQPPQLVRMKLLGGNAQARVVALDELPGKVNYFIGNDPKQWHTNVPTYARVKYQGVYPGVDLVYYGNQGGQLEYDFVVAPGADASAIALDVAAVSDRRTAVGTPPLQIADGGDRARITDDGDLIIPTGDGEVRFQKPVAYQEAPSEAGNRKLETRRSVNRQSSIVNRKSVAARFTLDAENRVRFALGPYDHSAPVVIDPVLVYSTYLGGSGSDQAYAIAVDSSGSAYVAGFTDSSDFPTANPLQAHLGGSQNAFVAKLNPAGSALVYSTYLGGSGGDGGYAIAVDSSGNAYVAGYTYSSDFPTANPLQAQLRGTCNTCGNAFMTKLNPAGSALVYSTYLGGSGSSESTGSLGDYAYAIAVDSSGSAYVAGQTTSSDFPTANPLQAHLGGANARNAFVTKLNPADSALVYSTYLGGSRGDQGNSIAVDSSGNAYVAGSTASPDFPTANPLQANLRQGNAQSAFVAKLNPAGSALIYSTYLGGSVVEWGNAIAVDSSGNAYVAGLTASANFPTANPLQANLRGTENAFVTKLNAAGSALVYSTYLGGSNNDSGTAIAVDSSGDASVTGYAISSDFPTADPLQANPRGARNAFVAKLNAAGSALVYSTYLGGSVVVVDNSIFGDYGSAIAVDSSGNTYVTGYTSSSDFPTGNPLQAHNGGSGDAFIAKIAPPNVPAAALSPASLDFASQYVGTSGATQIVTVTNFGSQTLSISGISASAGYAETNTCSTPLSPLGNCSISVTFTPTAVGAQNGTLTITNNDSGTPGSTQTVSLAGTGLGATVSPGSLTFSSQIVNTASATQTVTLSNTGNASITISNITTSSNFSQTNNCGGSLAGSGSCTINVAFAPTTGGSLTGMLTITDNSNNAAGSTQTVSLIGTGQDFTMTTGSGSTTTASVAPGQPATYTLALGGVGGISQPVNFTCSGAPSGSTCTVSPNPLTPGSSATIITVSVSTTAPSAVAPRVSPPLPPAPSMPKDLPMTVVLLAAVASAAWAWRRLVWSRRTALVPLGASLLLALALAGCGGGGGSGGGGGTHNPGTPAGTYTLTVTGKVGSGSSALSHSQTLTLTIT